MRTEGGHRRYDIDSLIDFRENRKTVAYARVSSHDQKNDLERQALVLEAYCLHHGYNFEIIKDLGSGLNYKKRGLQKILQLIVSEQIDRLVITNKDRLLRFGAELIFSLCEHFGVEIVILNRKEDASDEEDLAKDVLEIVLDGRSPCPKIKTVSLCDFGSFFSRLTWVQTCLRRRHVTVEWLSVIALMNFRYPL